MTNNPRLHYKPDLTMDTPIQVTLAAADWAILMAWFSGLPDETENGVRHIIYGEIGEQLTTQLYTAASIQGAKAHFHEQTEQPPIVRVMGNIFGGGVPTLRAEDAEEIKPRCENCGRMPGMPTAPCLMCLDYGV